MKTKMILAAAAALTALASGSWATNVQLGKGSKVRLEGKSTLHPWESECDSFTLDMSITGSTLDKDIQAQAPGAMTVKIPVTCLKSPHSGLDKNLQKALNAKESPDVVFTMKGYKLEKEKDSGGTSVLAWGDLGIAGKTQPENLKGSLTFKDGRTVIDGEQPLLMTDFGVKPPTMMMGAVKTDNRVVVKFHLELEPAADAAQKK